MPRHVVLLWRFIHQHFALAFLEHYARLQLFFTDRVNPSPWDASKECSWADRGKAPVKRRIRTIRRLWSLCPALHSRGNHDTPHAHFPPAHYLLLCSVWRTLLAEAPGPPLLPSRIRLLRISWLSWQCGRTALPLGPSHLDTVKCVTWYFRETFVSIHFWWDIQYNQRIYLH